MARRKEYKEEEVLEKAMNLFWRNGFESTSTRMLEKEMGINQFSIYSSFKNKEGLYLKSIKCYRNRLKEISDKLQKSESGIEGIKQYFYDFIDFSRENEIQKGCLVINTFNELGKNSDTVLVKEAQRVAEEIRVLFEKNLKMEDSIDDELAESHSYSLIIAMAGLTTASKVFNRNQLENFIETTFKNL